MTKQWDAVVIGGGHNGLVAAAYLAKNGLRTLVCERREVIGGASVSEHPFGPDYTVTSLSYVLSLLPPQITADLGLDRHGLTIYPQGPYFAPRRDGRALRLPNDARERRAEIATFSEHDADAYDGYERHLARIGKVLAPLLHEVPPKVGSHRPADLLAQARLTAHLRKVDVRGAVDITRLLTGSVADLLDRYFESDAMRGVLSVSGVIGTWAGPRSAGTAYVLLHHHIGEADGQAGAWGFPRGGMGAVAGALADAARSFGATIRTRAEVAAIRTRAGQVTGVALTSGEEIEAATVVTTAHPAISFLRLLDPADLPDGFRADIENWQTRSGTVKINLALDRLPVFAAHPDPDPEVYGGTIVLSESLDDVENAFQEAAAGKPSALPFADICIPSVFDDSLAPPGKHVMSMFTQWVPHTFADEPDEAALAAYADRVIARVEAVAPGFGDSVLHRQVIGPDVMQREYGLIGGNIFHGELSLGQMFHARPAAGYADLRTPVRGLYQAGSATHGGGGVTGIPGRNVAGQILADRRAQRWRERAWPGRGNTRLYSRI
ncbi:NAD(P)/FAD-dependent oxidoreductase [Trebonia sp.]|uniref:phytoene desaturase family protein n=1 Tax=Trebonia sp. TaxID=2767075 RepID=UPI002625BFD5|nr:NAD(P)/FAD-dependent oxidoreductase [Trebonia sp.]